MAALEQGSIRDGVLAFRPLAVLPGIVAWLLIGCRSGIGRKSMSVAAELLRIRRRRQLSPARRARRFSARGTLASSSTPRAPL